MDNLDSLVCAALDEISNVETESQIKDDYSNLFGSGDIDSSDDEDNRNFENKKYSESGRELKHLLHLSKPESQDESSNKYKTNSPWMLKVTNTPAVKTVQDKCDTMLGIRVINPLVSSKVLEDRMVGREFIPMFRLKSFTKNIKDADWVVGGVLTFKSGTKTTQKGKSFSIWTLCDLKSDLKTVSLFLFGSAYNELWKTGVGTVIGVLNPSVMDLKDGSKDEASLSVNNHQRVMIIGKSKDFGTCKSNKKSGERCTAIVNTSICEFCIYHVKQQYQNFSIKRSDLQANFSGGGLTALRNKVLGKDQVFYAGKIFSAIPAKKNNKQIEKDNKRLKALAGHPMTNSRILGNRPTKKARQVAALLESARGQRQKDLERLKQLGIEEPSNINGNGMEFNAERSCEVTLKDAKKIALDVISKLKMDKNGHERGDIKENVTKLPPSLLKFTPVLSGGSNSKIDLNLPMKQKRATKAKRNAVSWVQANGPIQKEDPNNIRGSEKGKKRTLEMLNELDTSKINVKKSKIDENKFFSQRFKKIMAATSRHEDLLAKRDNEEEEKYFKKLEMKEQMEEKMLTTYKMPCKAVRCLKCQYISFSASDLCKANKHSLKVVDATKRFFKCKDCNNRTVVLTFIPTGPCNNCQSNRWEKTGMMRERNVDIMAPKLSIRGGEQTFVNSTITNTNLDLMVCRKFNQIGGKLLTRGFFQIEKRHNVLYKRMKSMLPRRESERRIHPLARHCDILSAVETRLSMLSMTYMKYIANNACCFIPGKVLDEIDRILALVVTADPPPRAHELLQELRDISSMALEHFDEIILPRLKPRFEHLNIYQIGQTSSKLSKVPLVRQVIADEVHNMKKQMKRNQHNIRTLMGALKRVDLKFNKQNKILREKSLKIQQQERRLQEQSVKIQEQEVSIADLKKHVEEWDQKFSDLMAELIRAREDLNSKSAQPPVNTLPRTEIMRPLRIRPRSALPKYFTMHQFDVERKRKSELLADIPMKMSRMTELNSSNITDHIYNKINDNITNNISKSITDNLSKTNGSGASDDKEKELFTKKEGLGPFLSSSLEKILNLPISSLKARKRKIAGDIDLN